MDIRIAALHYYPIKSCAGTSASSVMLEDMGFAWDRRWMLVRESDGMFVTQRDCPIMARIRPSIHADRMIVAAPGMPELCVGFALKDAATRQRAATVWKFEGIASDEGDDAARWFGEILGFPCRLVRAASSWNRMPSKAMDGMTSPRVGFADGYAVLLASESSLADLNARLEDPVSMDRFRANLIMAGDDLPAWAEDGWAAADLPNSGRVLLVAKPCARCSMTTIDQATGVLTGPQPLKALSEFRRTEDNKVMFGSNLIYDSYHPNVKISVGDPLVPIERK